MGQEGGGWTFLKVIGVIVGLLGVVGFGLCSLFGFAIGFQDFGVLAMALMGAGIAALFGWMVAAIIRSARKGRDNDL